MIQLLTIWQFCVASLEQKRIELACKQVDVLLNRCFAQTGAEARSQKHCGQESSALQNLFFSESHSRASSKQSIKARNGTMSLLNCSKSVCPIARKRRSCSLTRLGDEADELMLVLQPQFSVERHEFASRNVFPTALLPWH